MKDIFPPTNGLNIPDTIYCDSWNNISLTWRFNRLKCVYSCLHLTEDSKLTFASVAHLNVNVLPEGFEVDSFQFPSPWQINDFSWPTWWYPSLQTNSTLSPWWKEVEFPSCGVFKMAPSMCDFSCWVEHVLLFDVTSRFLRKNALRPWSPKLWATTVRVCKTMTARKRRKIFIFDPWVRIQPNITLESVCNNLHAWLALVSNVFLKHGRYFQKRTERRTSTAYNAH